MALARLEELRGGGVIVGCGRGVPADVFVVVLLLAAGRLSVLMLGLGLDLILSLPPETTRARAAALGRVATDARGEWIVRVREGDGRSSRRERKISGDFCGTPVFGAENEALVSGDVDRGVDVDADADTPDGRAVAGAGGTATEFGGIGIAGGGSMRALACCLGVVRTMTASTSLSCSSKTGRVGVFVGNASVVSVTEVGAALEA